MRQPFIFCSYNVPVKFHLRDFQAKDFDTLWKIDQLCFAPGIAYSRMELKFYMKRRGSFTLVAETEDASSVAGFIVAEAGRKNIGHIITIDVLPEARRFRVGSELLKGVEARLLAAGCRGVVLETAVDNTPALAFYKRHGYFVVKTVPNYYSNGVDAFVLQKDLSVPKPKA
jgi:ribosomal-protein-alanine N-acetyltransferase